LKAQKSEYGKSHRNAYSYESQQSDNKAKKEKGIGVAGELIPGDGDFGFITGDTVDEHKLSPAANPANKQTNYYDYWDDNNPRDNYPGEVGEDGFFEMGKILLPVGEIEI